MKYTYHLLLIVLLGVNGFSYSQTTLTLLKGTWTLDYNRSIQDISSEAKTYYEGLTEQKKERIQAAFSHRQFTFTAEGKFTLRIRPEVTARGTWSLLNNQTILQLVMETGKTHRLQIKSFTPTEMILKLEEDSSMKNLFRKWYLKKVAK